MVRSCRYGCSASSKRVAGGVPVPVRGAKQRALLALLALQRGQPVSADRLIDVLWGDGQAANPANALQAQIGQLRRTLGAAAIVTSEAGYALDVRPDQVDVVRFEQLVTKGRRLAADGELAPASATLGEALGLRRGEPLAEFAYAGFADAERARLDELTLVATESRAGADLGLGRHEELAGELEALCREHPLRERLWELLILALYRSGRQAEALRAYAEVRDRLVDELGLDPGPALRELQTRILAQDPSLAPASALARPAPVPAARSGRGAGDRRQPAGAAGPLCRPRRRAGPAARGGSLQPARHADRPGRGGQDPPRGGGGRRAAPGAPRRRLAGRAGRRHRARRGGAGRRRRARGGRGRAREPSAGRIDHRAHRAAPGRTVAGPRPRQLRTRHRRGGRADRHPGRSGARSPADRHQPRAARHPRRSPGPGGRAGPGGRRRTVRRSRPGRAARLRSPTGRPSASSRTSAAGWTACRWPSSSPPPASARCRWPPWPNASTTASGCSAGAPAPPCPASRHSAPWWTGAMTCCSRTNAACSPGWPPSPVAAGSPRPRPSAPTTRSRRRDPRCAAAGWSTSPSSPPPAATARPGSASSRRCGSTAGTGSPNPAKPTPCVPATGRITGSWPSKPTRVCAALPGRCGGTASSRSRATCGPRSTGTSPRAMLTRRCRWRRGWPGCGSSPATSSKEPAGSVPRWAPKGRAVPKWKQPPTSGTAIAWACRLTRLRASSNARRPSPP